MQANVDEKPIAAEGQMCSLRFITVLRRANFPADDLEAATRDLEFMFDTYSTTQPTPRDSDYAAEIKSVNDLAEQLIQAVKGLSGRARHSVGYDALNLTKPLMAFYVQTKRALNKIPADKGGQKMPEKERNLMFQLAILWRMNFPNGKAITRTSAGEYSGPLLDFVENVLKFEGVRIQSSNALGKHLYEMRTATEGKVGAPCSLIDQKARQAKRRK